MIRIEGIPIVAARMADAEKAKSTQTRNMRRTSKIDAGGKAPLAIYPAIHSKASASGVGPD
jgi:hypothetical protein